MNEEDDFFCPPWLDEDFAPDSSTTESSITGAVEEESSLQAINDPRRKEKSKKAKFPFITSTLQQEASSKLNFTSKKTMMIAQKLYEGITLKDETVGLITYMRTDSTRISDVARKAAKEQIEKVYGSDYYENRFYKTKDEAQDARTTIKDKIKKTVSNILIYDSESAYRDVYAMKDVLEKLKKVKYSEKT